MHKQDTSKPVQTKTAGSIGVPQPEAEESKALATTEQSGAVVGSVDYGEDYGAGFENQTADDKALPFLNVLQSTSKEVADAAETGAVRGGMIINRTTGEVFEALGEKPGVLFVAGITEHGYSEWKPQKGPNGEKLEGGFVARHTLDEDVVKQAQRDAPFKDFVMPNGNLLRETFYVYGVQVSEADGTFAPVGLTFASTHIKPYKQWSYVANAIQVLVPGTPPRRRTPPLFSHVYRMTTLKKVAGGNTWFVPSITFARGDAEHSRLAPDSALYLAARSVRDSFLKGEVTVDYKQAGGGEPAVDEKAPF